MAVRLGSLRADIRRETEGDWVDIPDLPGVSLKVRSFNYSPYRMARDQLLQRFARRYGRDPVPAEESYRADARLYADHILLDWRGLEDDDGKIVPIADAADILADPAFRELHDHIRYAGTRLAQVEAEFVEDAGKNSPASSGGRSKAPAEQPTG